MTNLLEDEFARLERWVWLAVGALVLLMGGCWVYQSHASRDDVLAMKLKEKGESLATALELRHTVEDSIARLERYAATLHEQVGLADRRADSLTRVADRYRTFRLRVIDSLHVAVTASDTDRAEEIHEVPIQITEQLALDSAALRAQGDRNDAKDRMLAVNSTEIGALKKTVALDSTAMRALEGQVADLTAVKTPRFTFTQGMVAGGVLALTARFLIALLLH